MTEPTTHNETARGVLRGSALAACIAALVFAGLLAGCGPSVPDVLHLTLQNAKGQLTVAGFDVGSVTYDPTILGKTGLVVRQSPAAGTISRPGKSVDLVLSGPAPVTVPDLSGSNAQTAARVITARGLVLGHSGFDFDSEAPSGTVMFQAPAPGAPVAPGTTVNLLISRGPMPPRVPKVVGATLAHATELLRKKGLSAVAQNVDSTAPNGTVVSQNPVGGAISNPERRVSLDVSNGSNKVVVPDVIRMAEAGALAALKARGFKPKVIATPAPKVTRIGHGEVYSEVPSAWSAATKGSVVTLYVNP